jgi:sugar lactone lactonase YvrE
VAFGSAFVEGVYSMAPDGKGNVFFTELYTGQIRVVNNSPQNIGAVPPGTVGRIAGGTYGCKPGPALQAEMATPIGLARDPQGNLYAADWDCAVIWKISADYSTVTLLAGQPGNHTLADGTGSAAAFHYPRGLAYGVDGNLYVSEWYASVIRQVSLAGAVKTIAGVPNQLGEVDGPGAQAQFYHPGGLTMDQGGVLFVADWEPGSVRKITGIQTGNIAVTSILPAKPGDGGSWVRKYGYAGYTTLSVAAGANLYVNFWDAGVYRLAPAAAPAQEYVATLIVPTSGAITNALDPNGKDLWLGGWATGGNDQYLNTVRKYDLTAGQVTLTVGQSPRMGGGTDGTGQDATFSPGGSGGLAVDSTGTIWVADFAGQRVRKVTPDGKVTSIGSGEIGEASGSLTTAKFCYPGAITTVGTDAYVVDAYCSRRIMKIDSVTGTVTPLNSICVPNEPGCVIPTPPGGLVADQASPPNLYLTAYLEDNAGKGYGSGYDGMPMLVKVPNLGTGTPAFFAGTPNKYGCQDGPINVGRFGQWPYGLAVDAGGYLYVGDSQCGVRRVAPDGTISTLESTFGAVGVGVGPLVAGKQALYASRAGEAIWTVDRLTGAVAWLSGGGTSYTDHFKDGKLSEAKFWGPYGIATDSLGAIYVWDVYNTRVRVIYP